MRLHKKSGFTLIELLVVMAIIMILSGLILSVISYVNKKSARTRAVNEIAALSAALENYKADNGIYPDDGNVQNAGTYSKGYTDNLDARTVSNGDPTQSTYINAGLVLYRALSGDRNLNRTLDTTGTTDSGLDLDGNALNPPLSSPLTEYYHFAASQLLPTGGIGTITSIVDPFGYSYGYSTAYQGDIAANNNNTTATTPANGYNPTYDLWSTSAQIGQPTDTTTQTNAKRMQWITNWQNSGANSGQ
jgi:prepilin-type N-terminal cleavage/methylation domain-containing protein